MTDGDGAPGGNDVAGEGVATHVYVDLFRGAASSVGDRLARAETVAVGLHGGARLDPGALGQPSPIRLERGAVEGQADGAVGHASALVGA